MLHSIEKLESGKKNDIREIRDDVSTYGFSGDDYELMNFLDFKDLFAKEDNDEKFYRYMENLMITGEFRTIARYVQSLLADYGIKEAEGLDCADPAVVVALAEAVNLAAKSLDYAFYKIKPAVIVSAWKLGARFGYNFDEATYSLFHPSVGVASFHDPSGDVAWIVQELLQGEIPEWQYEWSGVYRQDRAFDILQDLKEMGELVAQLIRQTTPSELSGEGIDFRSGDTDSLLEMYGQNSPQVKLRDIVLASENQELRKLLKDLYNNSHSKNSESKSK